MFEIQIVSNELIVQLRSQMLYIIVGPLIESHPIGAWRMRTWRVENPSTLPSIPDWLYYIINEKHPST